MCIAPIRYPILLLSPPTSSSHPLFSIGTEREKTSMKKKKVT